MADVFALNLPQRVAQDTTLEAVLALGPSIILTARYHYSRLELLELILKTGMSVPEFKAKMKEHATNSLCSGKGPGAFTRLGGEFKYRHILTNGKLFQEITVEDCPRK